jgi:hypothetical protein
MSLQRKKYIIPATLSALVAGFGQILKGEGRKGLKIMVWFYMGLPIIIFGTLLLNVYLFLAIFSVLVIIYPIFWAMNIFDAYSKQVGIRRYQ